MLHDYIYNNYYNSKIKCTDLSEHAIQEAYACSTILYKHARAQSLNTILQLDLISSIGLSEGRKGTTRCIDQVFMKLMFHTRNLRRPRILHLPDT